MPAKSGKKGKKKKKHKKSKKEIEAELERLRLEQEAAERAEQARLAKERAEQEKKEKERKEAEAFRRAEEVRRLLEERIPVSVQIDEYQSKVKSLERDIEAVEAWRTYLECDPKPKAELESQCNTLYNEWLESTERRLQPCMQQFQYAMQIERDLETLIAKAQERFDDAEEKRCKSHLQRLRDLTEQRLDEMTANIIQFADEFANSKNEVQLTAQTADFKFGLWVNLAKNPRVKIIDYQELHISTEVPKTLALASVAIRVWSAPYDCWSRDSPNALSVLGPVVSVDLLGLPPPPKKVKGWTIRHVTSLAHNVQRLPYPIPPSGADPAAAAVSMANVTLHALPMRLSYHLPAHVILREEKPRAGFWDTEEECWREDGVTDVSFDNDTRLVSFNTVNLTRLALLQCRQIDLPYVGWTCRPTGRNTALFTVETHTCQIQIQVHDGYCQLLAPAVEELRHVIGVNTDAVLLLSRMEASGFKLTPVDWDATFMDDITPKAAGLERWSHYDLARASQVFTISGSKWNQSLGSQRLLVRLRKQMDWLHPTRRDNAWQSVLFEPEPPSVKCALVQASDDAPQCDLTPVAPPPPQAVEKPQEDKLNDTNGFSEEHEAPPIIEFSSSKSMKHKKEAEQVKVLWLAEHTHASLARCLQDTIDGDMDYMMSEASVMFCQQVQFLLNMLRPFSFC